MSTAANPRVPGGNPDSSNARQEPTGAIASDSLAAESINAGGEFSENSNAAISGVKGSNSTLNTTDTSGASVLPSARDGAERAKQDAKGLGSDEKGVSGVKYEAATSSDLGGTVSDQGFSGGPSSTGGSGGVTTAKEAASGATGDSFADGGAGITGSSSTKSSEISSGSAATGQTGGQTGTSDTSSSTKQSGTTYSSAAGANSGNSTGSGKAEAGTAPNYAATVSGAITGEGQLKPKGDNLTEGDIPQTKTFTGNVGGDKDPGRLAEQSFAKINADTAGAPKYSGSGSKDDASTGGAFDVLSSERAPDSSQPDRN